MSEVLNASERESEARQQAFRAQAGRSMALVEQALADEAFLKQNPHIGALDNTIGIFATLNALGSEDPRRTEKTRASLWNVIMTRLGTQDIPARRLTGPLADGSETPRTLAQDAHLFPGPALVKTLAEKISTGSVTINSRAGFDSVIREIYPLIETDIKKREREAIQAADPLRNQKLDEGYDEGYKDPLAGQTLLDTEGEIAAAKTTRQREALKLCIDAMSKEDFREQNPGFVRVMEAIKRFSKSRTAAEDYAQREEYEGALCHFFLTRKDRISMDEGMITPVTPEIENGMMRAIEELGEKIPALRSFRTSPAAVLAEQAEQKRSPRSEARGAAAEGDGRVLKTDGRVLKTEEPTEIILRTETRGSDFRECIRYFPQLVGREAAVQDTARNQKARLFINDMISDDGFGADRPDILALVQEINTSAHKIVRQDLGAHRELESFDYFGAYKNAVGTLWGALLLDKQDGGFHLPTREQAGLALAFFETPGISAKPVANEKGTVIGYESRGPNSPTEKLRRNLAAASRTPMPESAEDILAGDQGTLEEEIRQIVNNAIDAVFSGKPDVPEVSLQAPEVVAEVPVAAAPVAEASSGMPRKKPFEAVRASRIAIENLANGKTGDTREDAPQAESPEIVAVAEAEPMAEAEPQDILAAEEPAPPAESRGEKNRLLAKRDIDLISAQRERNVVSLRPGAKENVSQEPATGKAVPRVSSLFAKAAAVVLSVGAVLGIGGDRHTPDSRVAESEAPSFVSKIASFFKIAAVAPAYADSAREEKRVVTAAAPEPGMK